jgi:hypothetical protein
MQDVVDKAAIDRAIDTMNPVDPMSYKPVLTATYRALQHTNARIKHVMLRAASVASSRSRSRATGSLYSSCIPCGHAASTSVRTAPVTVSQTS